MGLTSASNGRQLAVLLAWHLSQNLSKNLIISLELAHFPVHFWKGKKKEKPQIKGGGGAEGLRGTRPRLGSASSCSEREQPSASEGGAGVGGLAP